MADQLGGKPMTKQQQVLNQNLQQLALLGARYKAMQAPQLLPPNMQAPMIPPQTGS